MKRVVATTAYVRSWLPSVWKRVLQRLVQVLIGFTMLPHRLLLASGSEDATVAKRRRWERQDGDAGWLHTRIQDTDEAELLPSVEALRSGRPGLPNTGNTCFVNAVIQCLLALPGFTSRLEEELERKEAENVAADQGEDQQKAKHESQLRLAVALLDLLQGLCPEADRTDTTEAASSSDITEAPITEQSGATEGRAKASHPLQPHEQLSSHSGKKRKRAMTTDPSDYSAAATKNRMRCFLQAASACTELVAGPSKRQDQQDAEELLLFILDALHDVLRNKPSHTQPDEAESDDKTPASIALKRLVERETECLQYLKKCVVTEPDTYNRTVCCLSDVRWQRYLMENRSFITEMFTGQIVRGSQCCSCANLTCLHQEYRVLSLTIHATSKLQTIGECLESHRRLEDLIEENKVYCDGHCKDKTSRRTQVLIQSAPQMLVIQLQRFKHSNWRASPEKIDASVQFPISESLDLTTNMFMRDSAKPVLYELQAVCAHLGSAMDAGHYIAYSRDNRPPQSDAPQRWVKYDDDYVTVLDEDTLRRETESTAYMLFYTQVALGQEPTEPEPQQSPQRDSDETASEHDDNI